MTPRPTLEKMDARGEVVWKWAMRLTGLAGLGYILIGLHGNAPSALFVGIFGLIGLPNVIGWQKTLRR